MILAALLAVIPGFTQLSLTDAQTRAVVNSVDVQTTVAIVRQKDAALQIARNGGIPHLTGDYTLAPQASASNTYTALQHFVTVGVSVSLNDILSASPSINAAAADLLAAQRNAATAVLRARQNATKLYFTALAATATELVREADLAGAQRDRKAASLRSSSGEAPQIDVVRADVAVAQARAALARARADRADAVESLASATAVMPDILSSVGGSLAIGARPLDEQHSTQRALAMRPELSALLATIDARRAALTLARQSGIPTATVNAGYQRGVDTQIPVAGAAVTAHVDLPIASSAGARTTSAQADVDIAQAQLVDERRTITLEVSAAVRDARALDEARNAAETARDEAARALAAVELGYREGASSSLDVADARRTYQQAEVDALVAQYQRAQALEILEVIVP